MDGRGRPPWTTPATGRRRPRRRGDDQLRTPTELADIELADRDAIALEAVVERNVQALVDTVASLSFQEPVAVLALVYSDGQDELEPAALFVCPRSHKDAVLATASPDDASDRLWDVNSWPGFGFDLAPWPSDDADFQAANVRIRSAAEAAGKEPVRWTLARVARAAARLEMPFATTADFVVTALDPADMDGVAANVRYSAPEAIVERLLDQFVLLPDVRPMDADEIVAHVEEVVDMDTGEFTGDFDCTLSDEAAPDGPQDLPLDEALEWAHARARRVRLTIGDADYSAGAAPHPQLPQWTGTPPPKRRSV